MYDESYYQNQLHKSNAKIAWQYGRLLSFAKRKNRSTSRVLDAGCGAGPGLRYLAAAGYRPFGNDLVEFPLRAARELVPEARLTRSDLNSGLPFADNSFDVIILSEVIEHVSQPASVLRECRRALDWEGMLVLTTPNLWDIRRRIYPIFGRVWAGDKDPTHVRLFDPLELRRALESAGFVGVEVRTGFKPLKWISSRRLHVRLAIPYPPLIGNTLVARGLKAKNAS